MTPPRIPRGLPALALALALAGCSHDLQLMKMEEQLNGYGGAIRWSMFKKAMDYYAAPLKSQPDWQALHDIKVTYYQPAFRDMSDDGKMVLQTVEIHYVGADGVVERPLTDEQVWLYNEDKGRWLLSSGFPRFK